MLVDVGSEGCIWSECLNTYHCSHPVRSRTLPMSRLPLLLFLTTFSATAGASSGTAPPDSLRLQDSYGNLGLGLDLHLLQTREDLLSPLRYAGPGLAFRLVADAGSPRYALRVEMKLGLAVPFNRAGHGAGTLTWGGRFAYVHRVRSVGPNTDFFAGASIISRTDDLYFVQWDDAHLYWLAAHAMGPALQVTHQLPSGRKLRLAAEFPLAALVGRPPERRFNKVDDLVVAYTWFGNPSRNLKVRGVPDYVAFDARIGTRLTRRTQIWWEIGYRTAREPRRVHVLEQGLSIQWIVG